MGDPIDVPTYGKFSAASDASAPLLVVFGGIDVDGVHSGVYMWNYMKDVKDRFHIFVARSNTVNGTHAHTALTSALKAQSLTPSQQILYLFSGGYRPGMDLLPSNGPNLFSSIFLVDIWMGVTKKSGSTVPDFYKTLADGHSAKITYVFTTFGANNDKARDYIANRLGSGRAVLVKGGGMAVHMSTNSVAVKMLP
ncbi:MAG TPA: hypothetical protein VLJ18_08510 [Thermoanaerobaculia bacterium]|nr:hypothetical protein [Thermoanaerobaculia bacterium]